MVKFKRNSQFVKLIIIVLITVQVIDCVDRDGFCNIDKKEECSENLESDTRYIFYDVNPAEGFNLRRDVYMRYAIFAKLLSDKTEEYGDIRLVLPPWSFLYHWQDIGKPEQIPWGSFFDLKSLQSFAPVIEIHQFFQETKVRFKKVKIEEVYVLQHFPDMFETNKFEDKMSVGECNVRPDTKFFHYKNLTSDNIQCLSFHGFTSQLEIIIEESSARSILFDRGEVALHDYFGQKLYWECRRSMRFNSELVNFANKFRRKFLNSNNIDDNVNIPDDWRYETLHRKALGGPYLAVHLRRKDFVRARPTEVPNLQDAAEQIMIELEKLQLSTVFLATDAPNEESNKIAAYLREKNYRVVKYEPTHEDLIKYKEGGVAIIDQIICAHAQYFIGTYESTFSFRIQEQREILGFPCEKTFNRMCGGKTRQCSPPTVWKIVY